MAYNRSSGSEATVLIHQPLGPRLLHDRVRCGPPQRRADDSADSEAVVRHGVSPLLVRIVLFVISMTFADMVKSRKHGNC
jgi:hypothetical protein